MNILKEEKKKNIPQDIKSLIQNSKFYDPKFYKRLNPNLKNKELTDEELLDYYIKHNKDELIPPSRFFDIRWYLAHNPDIKDKQIEPLTHFLKFGQQEKRLYRPTKLNFDILDLPNKNQIQEQYQKIFHSELFDIDYYLNNNGEFDLEGYDPIIHYILIGAKRGYNPSREFNTNYYTENKSTNQITINPLYHYIKYGKLSNEIFNKKYINQLTNIQYYKPTPTETLEKILDHLNQRITIIIPIHNAYEDVCRCIQSVLLNTHKDYELVLVNDASDDPRIDELLKSLSNIENIIILNTKENLGFVKSVNYAIKETRKYDVVILTSDTIVTPRWLSKLVIGAYKDDKIATVTPLSNNSDLSVSRLGAKNDQLFLNKVAYQLEKLDYNNNKLAPIGNSFCLYIKSGAIKKVGYFNGRFKEGYGEDVDFTANAYETGWHNMRSFDTFIYHKSGASFKPEKTRQLIEENTQINEQRHKNTLDKWDEFKNSPRTRDLIDKTKFIQFYENGERLLYITASDNNGNPIITDEYYQMAKEYETHVLALNESGIKLYVYDGIFDFHEIYETNLMNKDEEEIKLIYFNLITMLKYNLFFIRQIKYYSSYTYTKMTEFAKMSKALEIPVVYEGDAFYSNLMDEINNKLNPIESFDETIKKYQNKFNFKDKKVAVYTAITGDYDSLETPSVENKDFDYICFTNNPNITSNFWEIRLMEDDEELDEIRKARKYKILPHKYLSEYDYSIWIDGNFDMIVNIADYVREYSQNHKLLAIPHEARDCIYDEAEACIELEKDSEDIIEEQMIKYREEGFPEHYGLIASGILFRDHHDPKVIELMETWFNEVRNHSRRDQLSFNYACWKTNFQYDTSDIFYFKNQYFYRSNHGITGGEQIWNFGKGVKERVLNNIQRPTTIIIPVYNAYEDTKKCIKSVLKYTTIPYELLLIDDNSPDERINPMLREFSEKYDHIKLITNKKNQGFVANVNIGIASTSNDVLLLNSDTIVTPNWLRNLKFRAYQRWDIGTVTPLSNNAGAFSVPLIGKTNMIDANIGLEGTANIIEKLNIDPIETPTANGFCMYIRRAVIDEIGLFDLGFNMGYCEENDFSMRVINAGWKNIIDTTTFIYHNQGSSFGSEKQKLLKENRKYLDEKHPDYEEKVDEFLNDPEYLKVRETISNALADEEVVENNKKNILYVIHESKGGTPYTTYDLMQHVVDKYNVYLLTAGREFIRLYKFKSNTMKLESGAELQKGLFELGSWEILSHYTITNSRNEEFEQRYFNTLIELHIDIVHIRHQIRHSFDMPRVAHAFGIKVILSFHDLYYICPSHNLIDDRSQYCGGECTPFIPRNDNQSNTLSQCAIGKGLNAPLDIRGFLPTWRKNVSEMFKYCDEFVTTSQSTYDIYTKFYPELKDKPFHIIEHGRDLKTPDVIPITADMIDPKKPIKILLPGNINVSKGMNFITKLKKYDIDNRLEFHFMGDLYGKFKSENVGISHGQYRRSEFKEIVDSIDPMFAGVFSIWPETYCHTLTEAWSTGVPILTLDIGALGERVKNNGGGYIVSDDPKEAYEQIISYAEDVDEYIKVRKQVKDIKFPSTKDMADAYLEIYDKPKPNILFTGIKEDDSTSNITNDFMFELADYYNIYVLTEDKESLKLYKYNQLQPDFINKQPTHEFMDEYKYIKRWNIRYHEKLESLHLKQLETIADQLVDEFNIEIIQVEHLDENMKKVVENIICDDSNEIKIITSINTDEYLPDNIKIGKTPTTNRMSFTQKILQEEFIQQANKEEINVEVIENNKMSDIIKNSSELVFRSQELYDKYTQIYPEIKNIKTSIIENNVGGEKS